MSRSPTAAHRALVYEHPAGFVEPVSAFLREGLSAGDRVLAAVSAEKLGWLREALGEDAKAMDSMDAGALYERHGPMFRTVAEYLRRHGAPGGGAVRIVAEHPLAGREPIDARAYMRYEAASNLAFGRFDASILCPYDAQRLPDDVLTAALETHPEIVQDGRVRPSERFTDPRAFVRGAVRAAPAPSRAATCPLHDVGDLARVRAHVRAHAEAAGLPTETVADFTVAVNEIAANALLHGGPPRQLWSYVEDGRLVCQVRDAGTGLDDPLAGYLPPDPERLGGRGLWLAHQLCDIVEVADDDRHTTVYLHVRLPAQA